ncbi:preprotein translocase YidC [Wenjunlia vitaminophila]|uniref:Membrane protein insertase YidC n=1 Tax=Wenjunlia vitaminophila TaxID=76728 RepID=A0A0T6LMT6_WENVI|nr:preprotein translocase YidC [Wenjunlia vitaminophila]
MGLLNPLYDAVSWIIVQFHSLYSHVFDKDSGWAWGLSIVSLVIVIRICLIPLFVKQIKATRNMQALQPRMKAIQERYKNDRQRQSEEMMKLYKETGTNPFSSCLPILVQSPFFFALYHVLTRIANGHEVGVIRGDKAHLVDSAREAKIFGAPIAAKFMDSQEKLDQFTATLTDVRVVTVIMIVLMSLSQFTTQRQLMTKNVNLTVKTPFMQQQKMLMYVFPIVFAVFGINFPVGVLVYWLTTNFWTMCQQLIVIRRNPTPGSKAFEARQERLKAKGKGLDPKTGKVVPLEKATAPAAAAETATVRRQQPKRQTKAKRQTGGTATRQQPGGSESPQDAEGPSDAGGSGKAAPGKGESGGAPDTEKTSSGRSSATGDSQDAGRTKDKSPQDRPRQGSSSSSAQSNRSQGGQQRKGGKGGRQGKGGKPRQPTGSRPGKK